MVFVVFIITIDVNYFNMIVIIINPTYVTNQLLQSVHYFFPHVSNGRFILRFIGSVYLFRYFYFTSISQR